MDSLEGTREAPGRQERTNWTECGGTREAGKDQLDRKSVKANLCHEEASKGQRQSRAPSGLLKASLCYEQPAVGPTPGLAANRAVRH